MQWQFDSTSLSNEGSKIGTTPYTNLVSAIFVEIFIRADIERVWELTQIPSLHQRWDLRFTEISYLPKSSQDEPQRFLYRTRIGFGLPIEGEGESVGERSADGKRTSALKFWSKDWRSLILEGSGYWQYEPTDDGLFFRTSYDYRVRFGVIGKFLDLVFRPIIGAATAWSFDTMRLWAEKEIPPEFSVLRMRIHAFSRVGIALIWAYTGLVPKLLASRTGELELIRASGISPELAPTVAVIAGVAEIIFGVVLIVFWRINWLLLAQAILTVVLPLGLIASKPELFLAPFNPVTLSLSLSALGICGYVASLDMPSAGNCRRRPQV